MVKIKEILMKTKTTVIIAIFIQLLTCFVHASEVQIGPTASETQAQEEISKRNTEYYYTYVDRSHTREENINNIAGVYGVTWLLYPLTQFSTVRENGSLAKYRKNFGKVVFDQDEPFWNWFVHPISGSQLFLFYRARGYSRSEALTMSFISSSLFEFTVEIYTEPASVQDLYQTPVLGAVLGLGIEKLSLYLLNTGNLLGKIIGHAINPSTLLWYYEGKVRVIPQIAPKQVGLNVQIDL
ncbi:PF13084 domain protein [Bacteriovorax sp. Seq25_V]|nr:PF13084 domain protein [Bacteriovorax sp. Seq25_V]